MNQNQQDINELSRLIRERQELEERRRQQDARIRELERRTSAAHELPPCAPGRSNFDRSTPLTTPHNARRHSAIPRAAAGLAVDTAMVRTRAE